MTKKQKEYQQSLDKCKQSQSQQLMEQQHRIEMVIHSYTFVSLSFSPLNLQPPLLLFSSTNLHFISYRWKHVTVLPEFISIQKHWLWPFPVVGHSAFSLLQLQQSGEEARSQMLLMEHELSSLQRERDEAQDAVLLLQSSMVQLTQVRTLLTACGCMLIPSLVKAKEQELQA